MCGIAGIIDFRGRPVDEGLLRSFCRVLSHRGPDDAGIWAHEGDGFSVGLAHTRLAVIDPTPDAHQPMTDPSGRFAVTYNGELYNYGELRSELPAPTRTASDTEVALQGCIAWGPDALGRFDAMWALAFVDVAERTGHLSRDPFGIKPLYYMHVKDRLVFASELTALRCFPDAPTEIDPDALACYLNVGYIPHPQTIYRGVRKLPPGHLLRFSQDGPGEPERYPRAAACSPRGSSSSEKSPDSAPSFREAATELRTRIESAVVRQRIADVPLGAFLSGGLDSSIVVACLAQTADMPVKTFSIGYADHPRYDETDYARMVADRFGTEHHAFRLTFNDVLDTVEPMLDHLGEPFADSSLLPTSLVSRYTREHVTVALSGDGGDELFGGYWRYLGHHYLSRYHRLPAFLRKGLIEPVLRQLPAARSTRWLDRLRQARKLLRADLPDPIDRHLAWARYMDDDLAAQLLGQERAEAAMTYLRQLYREAPQALSPSSLQNILLADLTIGLPADMLHKVDTASMYHSLEVRVPLLSTDVVDFATALPIEYKISGSSGKRILREAFRDVLPTPVVHRSKRGFEVPVGEFLRRELREMYHDVVTPSLLGEFGLDSAAVDRLYEDHLTRRQDHNELLWALLVLCRWKHRQGCRAA